MNSFVTAAQNQTTYTDNGMPAFKDTSSKVLDLFYNIGASRGKDIIPAFTGAYVENKDLAGRVALWARDIREGAGERETFRVILRHLCETDPEMAQKLVSRIPDIGRWDDVLETTGEARNTALGMIRRALATRNGLCAKWLPRQGPVAVELRNFLGMTPKQYRKTLVNLTQVVETKMCAKEWNDINFNHVPSVASARYKKAFNRHTPKYAEWAANLATNSNGAKINASAIYPHEVLKGYLNRSWGSPSMGKTEKDVMVAQWNALPNYMTSGNILPMVDVSGSMSAFVGGSKTISCMDVAVSLGLYCADKNTGPYKDMFLTFSKTPELQILRGDITQKIDQITSSTWGMNTNLEAAFKHILHLAVENKVLQQDMPTHVLIMSDMQFDTCVKNAQKAMDMIKTRFNDAGYDMPGIVFWNLNSSDNAPAKQHDSGVALISGFSPTILKSVLSASIEDLTPMNIMLKTIMSERYSF